MVPVTPASVEGPVPSHREITNSQCGCHVREVREVGGPVLLVACLPSPPSPTCAPLTFVGELRRGQGAAARCAGEVGRNSRGGSHTCRDSSDRSWVPQETSIAPVLETERRLRGEPWLQGPRVLVRKILMRKGLGRQYLHPREPLTLPGPCFLHWTHGVTPAQSKIQTWFPRAGEGQVCT